LGVEVAGARVEEEVAGQVEAGGALCVDVGEQSPAEPVGGQDVRAVVADVSGGADAVKDAHHALPHGFAEGRNNLFSDPTLTQIGAAHGKSIAQIVLRWLTQRNIVAIPKSVRPERMAQNLDIFDFTLTDDEMDRIAAMDTGATLFFDHRDPAMVSAIGNRPIHD
jgi:2,5-diketo-D-gluconate reductase A